MHIHTYSLILLSQMTSTLLMSNSAESFPMPTGKVAPGTSVCDRRYNGWRHTCFTLEFDDFRWRRCVGRSMHSVRLIPIDTPLHSIKVRTMSMKSAIAIICRPTLSDLL